MKKKGENRDVAPPYIHVRFLIQHSSTSTMNLPWQYSNVESETHLAEMRLPGAWPWSRYTQSTSSNRSRTPRKLRHFAIKNPAQYFEWPHHLERNSSSGKTSHRKFHLSFRYSSALDQTKLVRRDEYIGFISGFSALSCMLIP